MLLGLDLETRNAVPSANHRLVVCSERAYGCEYPQVQARTRVDVEHGANTIALGRSGLICATRLSEGDALRCYEDAISKLIRGAWFTRR